MKFYVDIYIPIFIIFGIGIWKIWFEWSRRRLARKYNPDDDKSRRREEFQRETSRIGEIEDSSSSSSGLTQPEGQKLLETTMSSLLGEDNSGNRSNGSKVGEFFKGIGK